METPQGNKKFLLSVLVLCIIPLLSVVFLIKTFFFKPTLQSSTNPTQENSPTVLTKLPIPSDDSHVKSVTLFYTLTGTLTAVDTTSITLDSLPPFSVKSDTVKVYKGSPSTNKGTPTTYKEVKNGAKATVYCIFNVSTNNWYVSQISLE